MLGRVSLPGLTHQTFPLTKMPTHANITGCLSSARGQVLFHATPAAGFRSKETVLDWFAT